MGFTRGAVVEVIKNAPLRDPIEYAILGYNISLRRSEAEMIEVEPISKFEIESVFNGSEDADPFEKIKPNTEINIALVGNPNAGKTTLFNLLSNQHEHVGNYSGVTVGATASKFKYQNYTINIVDLPGTYSISSFSPEEVYVRNHLLQELPDIVLNVVDAGNLHRNLYLTTQLIDMDLQLVMALNMFDDLDKNGEHLDYKHLGGMLGIPMVPTVASKKKGINELLNKIIEVFEGKETSVRHIHIHYGKPLDKAIKEITDKIKIPRNHEITNKISSRFVAIKLLEGDEEIENTLNLFSNTQEIKSEVDKWVNKIKQHSSDDLHTLITDAKYGFIDGALKETYKIGAKFSKRDIKAS
jgi:ferrous iron transport protein B